MADQSRQEPAKFIAEGAAFSVLAGTALIIVATTEVGGGHGIATIGWFRGGLALVILGILLFVVATILFYRPTLSDRLIVDITSEQLTALFDGVTNVQGRDRVARYIGKWMRVSGTLDDVRRTTWKGVMVTLEGRSAITGNSLYCFFWSWRQVDRINLKNPGDELTLIGRITDVNGHGVTLSRCRLEAQGRPISSPQVVPAVDVTTGAAQPRIGAEEMQQESESAPAPQEPERVVIDKTPKELIALFEGVTNVQGRDRVARYIGKWMRIAGSVADVQQLSPNFAALSFQEGSIFTKDKVSCYFRDEKWIDRLAMKDLGDHVAVIGRIERVNALSIDLYDCELEA